MELVAFGHHAEDDAEMEMGWWSDWSRRSLGPQPLRRVIRRSAGRLNTVTSGTTAAPIAAMPAIATGSKRSGTSTSRGRARRPAPRP